MVPDRVTAAGSERRRVCGAAPVRHDRAMRVTPSRRPVVLLGTVLCLALLQQPGSAACIPHSLSVEPTAAAADSTVVVRGEGWFIGCNDTGQGTREPPDTAQLTVEQDGDVFELGRVTADSDYRFALEVRLPAELQPGAATVVGRGEDGQASAALTVTTRAQLPRTGAEPALGVLAVLVLAVAMRLRGRPVPHP